jgi:hypothetical protein
MRQTSGKLSMRIWNEKDHLLSSLRGLCSVVLLPSADALG